MQHFQRIGQNRFQRPQGGGLGLFRLAVEPRLHHLDIPVAEFLPDEVVDLLYGDAQLELLHIFRDFRRQHIDLVEHPAILQSQGTLLDLLRNLRRVQIHQDEPGGVPHLIGKIPAGLHALPVETHVVARRISGHQRQPQGIGPVFVDNLQRINAVTQRFAHLTPQRIPHQTVDQHMLKGRFPCLLQSGEHHADYPEKDNIVTRHQHAGGVKIIQLRGMLRPAQGREGPEGRRKPGVQRVLVLPEMSAAAFGTFIRRAAPAHNDLATVLTVPGRNPVAPPELT